jgi:hypothetical protein
VSIQRVEALRCAVVPCAYADLQVNTDLPDGGDCRLVFEDYGEIRLRLAVDPRDIHDHPAPAPNLATASAVLEQLQANEGSFVEIAGPGSPIDWLVRIGDGQVYLVPASGWTAPRGADAKAAAPPLFGPAPLDDKLAEWLGDRLRRIARVHNLLKLATDESGSLVHAAGGVDIMIELLQYADAKATDFKVVPWNNGQILRTGEIVGFRVTNNSQEAVDLTLLHVDSDYSIRSYFPRAGFADNRVRPRESIIKRFRATPADGPEHMVAIAVRAEPQREPMSFSCLEQDAIEQAQVTRGGPQSLDSPLGKLLQSALFAKGQTRGLDDVEVDSHTVRQLTWRVIPAGN